MSIKVLHLRSSGMFSNVNEVIQHLYMAEIGNYEFVINWSNSCYLELEKGSNPWLYYFHQCFENCKAEGNLQFPVLPTGAKIACAKNNVITPRLVDGQCVPLLLPKDRMLPYRLIKRYLKLTAQIESLIDTYYQRNFVDNVVLGLHIRGPGRVDGGAPLLRSKFDSKGGVPFAQYFQAVDKQLDSYPDAKIFICTDSNFVLNEVVAHYGQRVISYPATRSEFGEMHERHPMNAGQVFSPYKLGEDVLVEAYLLSMSNYFIHGNSNVANFVLCNNLDKPAEYVYQSAENNLWKTTRS